MATIAFDIGTRCWFPDDNEGWINASVTNRYIDGEKVTLEFALDNGETKTVETTLDQLDKDSPEDHGLPPLRNPPILEATEDLTNLSYLNEPAVLHTIKTRYSQLSIYTYSGIVLIAANPFAPVSLYGQEIVQMYAGRRRGELEPHLFAIAEDAYRCMLRDETNQTVVVSGESGAGKTVSAKYIMRYFATVEDPDKPATGKRVAGEMSSTETAILATNPIMEAFGNAKTTRNDNSSRFGKYIEIMFDEGADIVGARIRTYLLERSRLVFQPATERNYHIFYQLVAGATEKEREEWSLKSVEEFEYLNQGGDPVISGVDDAAEFVATREALVTIGVDAEVQHDIFKVLAALLHLGNVQIGATRTDAVLASTEENLVTACKLLGVDAAGLAKWMVKKQITTRSEKIQTNLNQKQALVVRDSVAKYIYASLFDWLVANINTSLASPEVIGNVKNFIGVLDIYGFEHFAKNSFEQFCINYANEKLQQEFNQHVFKLEQEEYVREEIPWTFIDYADNQPCIDLIEAKLGILSLLDEESRLPAGSDEGWVRKLYDNFAPPGNKDKYENVFRKPRFGTSAFTVCHYALDVEYESEGFIEKNRDSVPEETLEVLMKSENVFLAEVLKAAAAAKEGPASSPAPAAAPVDRAADGAEVVKPKLGPMKRAGAGSKKPTLGGLFKMSLIDLMNTINSTNVHYIRCIKPNEKKAAWEFEPQMVLSQLRACGVLETIRISCAGFPSRWTYEEFCARYYMLVKSDEWQPEQPRSFSEKILKATIQEEEKFQLGLTKIFFRAGLLAFMEKLRSDRLNAAATFIQKNMLRNMQRKKYLRIRKSVLKAQALFRGYAVRKRVQEMKEEKAAVTIQKVWRGQSERKRYVKTREGVVKVQALFKGYLVRKKASGAKKDLAATRIQTAWRGSKARGEYKETRRKVVHLQSCWRRKMARDELQKLKVEAKSVSHFKEVSYRLENKVVELQQNLMEKTQNNKDLKAQLAQLEAQISGWQEKHASIVAENETLKTEAGRATEALAKAAALEKEMQTLQAQLDESHANLDRIEQESKELKQSLDMKAAELEASISASQEEEGTRDGLLQEVESLKKEVSRLSALDSLNGKASVGQSPPRGESPMVKMRAARGAKRHSYMPLGTGEDGLNGDLSRFGSQAAYAARPASVAITNQGQLQQLRANLEFPAIEEDVNDEIMRILEEDDMVNEEVMLGLIQSLKIPQPSLQTPPSEREILFPAHLINLVTSEMWKYGFIKESERFLANVMQTVQEQVMTHELEDAIIPGAFWLSNVHEMLSFVVATERDILHGGASADLETYVPSWLQVDNLRRLAELAGREGVASA
ncbi:hypothetical protein SAICODRAFT_128837 [Saitoella complicata NRRL Y-17804]|uniref:uncharacterized protein n=1 Tax=Saitoella complicata (strain BCRC 22490 / CBS 7301 / JCM 7358 / NBRC 10748 / NRRL Y-17804) TaxID=698492 RepID=UPI000867E0E4|nr:uncharacterized protein SAICODRAFT_128837 [Saitoella complicata NRRL Y-17804]ODQ52439.1 hypothetical protein SAICODRAFT_128837 [Saitoella complicata NRRL Y-17804]